MNLIKLVKLNWTPNLNLITRYGNMKYTIGVIIPIVGNKYIL